MDIDTNGILNVVALEKSTNKESKFSIPNEAILFNANEIDDGQKKLAPFHNMKRPNKDTEKREAAAAKRRLESYCDTIQEKCTETYKWLHANHELVEKEQYERRYNELKRLQSDINITVD